MVLQTVTWWSGIVRGLCSSLDYIVYTLIKVVLFGIFDLSSLTTSSGILNGIYNRIYVILGIFMVFKLSFSFFQYIVDPESMSGKNEKGVSKLISRTIIMLLVLVAVPNILFNTDGGEGIIQRAQKAFLPMLPRILLGINEESGISISNNSNTASISLAADTMAISTLQAFFAPSTELDSVCGQGTYADTPYITSLNDFLSYVGLTCTPGVDLGIVKLGTVYYKYSYTFIVSTIVGALLLLMLLGITIDIAKRVFKMIILEVIAPIPIMTLIDPKSSKDGAFSHWIKALISTFLEIFLKLGILYVVIMFVQLIVNNGLFNNLPTFSDDLTRATYLRVLLILGLIFFAKEAPKFIKDSMGIKDSGNGLGTGLGGAVGALSGLISGRGLSGMVTGAIAGATADPKKGAWAAGRDAAGRARTGDKNYNGDLGTRLLNASAKRQSVHAARKLGITLGDNGTIKMAKKNMLELADAAEEARMKYEEAMHSGADAETVENLRNAYRVAQSASENAKKQYDAMNKVVETYGLTETKQEEQIRKNRHRAVRNAINLVEKVPGVGNAVSFIDNVNDIIRNNSDNRQLRRFVKDAQKDKIITYDNLERDASKIISDNDQANTELKQQLFKRRRNDNNDNH